MDNPFSILKEQLHELYRISRMNMAKTLLVDVSGTYSIEEVEAQYVASSGPVIDKLNAMMDKEVKKTTNVEILTALGLSNFYFGTDTDTTITFEMKSSFNKKDIPNLSYENLATNINSATHVDCKISDNHKELLFQIKTYPQKWLKHENSDFIKWLDEEVISYYGSMKSTILVVLLQPKQPPSQTAFDFKTLASQVAVIKNNSFDEIALTYNEYNKVGQNIVLQKLTPTTERATIDLKWMLDKFRGTISSLN